MEKASPPSALRAAPALAPRAAPPKEDPLRRAGSGGGAGVGGEPKRAKSSGMTPSMYLKARLVRRAPAPPRPRAPACRYLADVLLGFGGLLLWEARALAAAPWRGASVC
jgi:hypothetical protein